MTATEIRTVEQVAPAKGSVPPLTRSVRISSSIQIVGAVLLLVLLFLEWVRGGRTGLEGNGGGGFGVLALFAAVVVLYAAIQGLRGKRTETKILGPNQLGIALSVSVFTSNLVFLWVFNTGGAPKWVYVASNVMVYSSIIGLFSVRSEKPPPLAESTVRALGAATVVLGAVIAAAPLLEYTKLSSISFTGFEPGSPRIGVLLLFIGAIVIFYGLHRMLRGNQMVDLGPFVLWPHVTMGLGVLATGPAFAWVVSGLWGGDFDPGIGAFVNLIAGIALIGLGGFEAAKRAAKGV